MHNDGKKRCWSGITDAILGAGVLVFFAVCVGMLMGCFPAIWGRCLTILDVRNWNHWTRTGIGVVLLAVFLLIRLWPERILPAPEPSPTPPPLEQSENS